MNTVISNNAVSDFFCIGINVCPGHFDALQGLLHSNSIIMQECATILISEGHPHSTDFLYTYIASLGIQNLYWLKENTELKPGNIYIVPENKIPSIKIHSTSLLNTFLHPVTNQVTNSLFISLAESFGRKAIAIILADSENGFLPGIKAIKEKGGHYFFKESYSIDPDDVLNGFANKPLPESYKRNTDVKTLIQNLIRGEEQPLTNPPQEMQSITYESLNQILQMVFKVSGIDFQHYKDNTLIRRLGKRINLLQLKNPDNYLQYLKTNPDEARLLKDEFLISVTQFYRDPEAFQIVRDQLIPALLKSRSQKQINIWSAGCASGEEAYTLAILFHEYISVHMPDFEVKIIATDIDEHALEKARAGKYPSSISNDLPPTLLKKYFFQERNGWTVHPRIQEMVDFRKHNITIDPPYFNMDLICCRNLLIYLKPHIQKRILNLFRCSLSHYGALILGNSESLGELLNFFEPVDNAWRIYFHKSSIHSHI